MNCLPAREWTPGEVGARRGGGGSRRFSYTTPLFSSVSHAAARLSITNLTMAGRRLRVMLSPNEVGFSSHAELSVLQAHPTLEEQDARCSGVAVPEAGVAGLTVADELSQRLFEVHVFERRDRLGRKARRFPSGSLPSLGQLVSEHCFRFISGFTGHLPDSMRKIRIEKVN
jgi:NAD(P)-binding Rossmann-like domain